MRVKLKRVAMITGGSYGIGKACSVALAECGIHVVVMSRKREKGLEILHELNQLGVKAIHVETDVSDRDQVRKSVARVYNEFQRIDILVNNAGIVSPLKYFFEQKNEEWDQVIKVHLYGTYHMMKELTPIMMRQKYGRIVNISSTDTYSGSCGRGNYVAAKCGIEGLTLTAAKELGEYGITVNVVRPGYILTPLTTARGYDFDAIANTTPRQRIGAPEDIARIAKFLAMEESDFITGQIISVDGGWSLSGAGLIHELMPLKGVVRDSLMSREGVAGKT